MNIAELLNKNCDRFPTKGAIGFKKKDKWTEISWNAFRRLVFKTANALRSSGIGEGDRVAIFSDNSAEWIVMDLAVLALGGITVPVYATNTEEQAAYILKEAACKIILTGNQEQYDAAANLLTGGETALEKIIVAKKATWIKKEHSVYLEDFIKEADENFDIIERRPEELATLIYTSGTTGVPKGVMLTHGNFINCIEAHFDYFKFKNFENEVSLAFLPLTHVFERSWTLLSLFGGAKVYFLENTKLIASALTEVKPTMMCAVPRFYQKIYAGVLEMAASSGGLKKKIFNWALEVGTQAAEYRRVNKEMPFLLRFRIHLAHTLVFNKIHQKMGGRLWFMPCGGASVSADVTRFFEAIGLHITVGYGLTETTATLTAFPLDHYIHGSAGQPFGDTEIRIGENDEIQAKGSGIMKGYYLKPEETAAVFTEDGWFRTGDAGKIDEEGNLTITDRIKDLMKTSNGKYVVPQPIENMLSDNNYIQQAMIVAEDRPYVTALIIPNFEALQQEIERRRLAFTNWAEMVNTETIRDLYRQKIDEIQQHLPGFEKIKKFVLMPSEFEISTGEITPTLKVKRNVILKKYAALIENMYSGNQPI